MQSTTYSSKKSFVECYNILLSEQSSKKKNKLKSFNKKIESSPDSATLSDLYRAKARFELNVIFKTFQTFISQYHECDEEADFAIIQSTFTQWRAEAYKIWSQALQHYPKSFQTELKSAFVKRVDYEFLPEFSRRIRMRYAQSINIHKFGLSSESVAFLDDKLGKIYKKLLKAICKWLLNIELVVDLIHKLTLYDIMQYETKPAMEKCKEKWKATGPTGHVLKTQTWDLALKVHGKVSNACYRLIRSLAVCHLPAVVPLCLTATKGTIMSKALMVPLIGYAGALSVGILSIFLMQAGENTIKRQKAAQDFVALTGSFKAVNTLMSDILRQCNVGILEIVCNENEEVKEKTKTKIKDLVEMLLEKKRPKLACEDLEEESWDKEKCTMKYLKCKEIEEDWVYVSKIEVDKAKINEEDIEGALKLSLVEMAEEEKKQ